MAFTQEQRIRCQSHLAKIHAICKEYDDPVFAAASEATIAATAKDFNQRFGFQLPDGYLDFLRLSDGLDADGTIIWPTTTMGDPGEYITESIVDANLSFRSLIDDGYLFLGQRDDSVFVKDLVTGRFLAAEIVGMAEWETFPNCEAMIEFMLATVAGVFPEEGEAP